jgi:hypothetical protein
MGYGAVPLDGKSDCRRKLHQVRHWHLRTRNADKERLEEAVYADIGVDDDAEIAPRG